MPDWDGFIAAMPTNQMLIYLLQNRRESLELHLAVADMMIFLNFTSIRDTPVLAIFWQNLLEVVREIKLPIPPVAIQDWNTQVVTYDLPEYMVLVPPSE